jgi:lysophospholipase L1-like esterase
MRAVSVDELVPILRAVRTLAVLGDSIGVGVGDPAVGGGWRGYPPLLAEALGAASLVNVARNGARVGCVRREQLPVVARAVPDAAVVLVGMNDTMRSDFDAERLRADMDAVVSALTGLGALVVTVRYHDHGRIFRLPGPLRRALAGRIHDLNTSVDVVAARYGAGVIDLDALPGAYERTMWSVDRLHPSEFGHRMLAKAFADWFAVAGALVPGEVSTDCADSVPISRLAHVGWLVGKGIPWLWRRGRDLVPYAAGVMLHAALHPTRDPST